MKGEVLPPCEDGNIKGFLLMGAPRERNAKEELRDNLINLMIHDLKTTILKIESIGNQLKLENIPSKCEEQSSEVAP